jgi:hypothetical protein
MHRSPVHVIAGGFILRIFSTAPVVVEQVESIFCVSRTGDWKRSAEV